jgi:hypothetical protein
MTVEELTVFCCGYDTLKFSHRKIQRVFFCSFVGLESWKK